jgi:hypothetical protein
VLRGFSACPFGATHRAFHARPYTRSRKDAQQYPISSLFFIKKPLILKRIKIRKKSPPLATCKKFEQIAAGFSLLHLLKSKN